MSMIKKRGSIAPSSYWGVELTDNQILDDDGYYNAFPMGFQAADGRLYVFYKKSGSHAAKGPFTVKRSTLVSGVFEQFQVKVNGTFIQSAAHSCIQTPTGRFLIAYQDDEAYTSVKIAYTDGDPANGFTLLHTIDLGTGYSSSPSPVKMLVMPSGAILFTVYRFGLGANPAIIQDIKLTANGNTWAWGAEIFNNSADFPTGFPDWKVHEFGRCIVENTGVDSTCKIVGFARVAISDEGGTKYLHTLSTDGGGSYSADTVTEDAGTFTDDNGATVGGPFNRGLLYSYLSSNSPMDMILWGSTVVGINGERNGTNGYKPKYITATPTGAARNKFNDWARPVAVGSNYNAFSLGGSIDCGYPVLFEWKLAPEDTTTQLWFHDYDVSTQTRNPALTEDRCWIRQKRIVISAP